eukprot:symbB.v1.2.026800.t1/scaffold2702.1/size74278/1
MGCAASGSAPEKPAEKQEDVSPVEEKEEPTTWASKPTTTQDTFPSLASSFDERRTVPAAGSATPKAKGVIEPTLVLSDPDDEDYGIEVICEGKTTVATDVEPQSELEALHAELGLDGLGHDLDAVAVDDTADGPPPVSMRPVLEEASSAKPMLSKQQLEEAAKMAEHRKRFDNQKYHSGASDEANVATGGTTSQPTQDVWRAHEAVMGVNASFSPRKVQEATLGECLPGGIVDDDILTEAAPAYRNNHQLFDDDEEMLMKEILDSVDA